MLLRRRKLLKWTIIGVLILSLFGFLAFNDLQQVDAQTATPTSTPTIPSTPTPFGTVTPSGTPILTPTITPLTFNLSCGGTDLENAIATSNGYLGDDVINLQAGCNYMISSELFIGGLVNDSITINGNGATILANDSVNYIFYVQPQETLILNNLRLRRGYYGIANYGTTSLSNVSVGWGGTFGVLNLATLTMTDSEVLNNGDTGVYNGSGASATISRTHISGNGYLYTTAGVWNSSGSMTISESSITDNGQGINSNTVGSGSLTVSRTTISDNTTDGLYIRGYNTSVSIDNSTISGNSLPVLLLAESGTLTAAIRNSTITANDHGSQAGALEIGSTVNLTLENSVIAGNSIATNAYEITIRPGYSAFGTLTYAGNNFIGSINPSLKVSGTTGQVRTGNPMLLALADNGGFGKTHKPSLGSRLLDAGICSTTMDQRGATRPINLPGVNNATSTGFCDIGAVEVALLAADDSYTAVFNTALVIPVPGILENDGTTSVIPLLVSAPVNGELTLNTDGSFTYMPDVGFLGADSFSYNFVHNGAESNVATVSIEVVAPIATDDAYTTTKGQTLTVIAPGVLANDVDRSTLTASLATSPLNGSVSLNQNGGFTYIPNTNFVGTDSFTYIVNRNQVKSSPARVVINVTGSSDVEETSFDPAPTNLRIVGSLIEAPVILTFRWDVVTSRVGLDILSEYHNLQVTDDNGVVIYEEWLPASQICSGITCEVTLDEERLAEGSFTNGFYRWHVQTWTDGIFSRLSDERGFEVNVSTPILLSADIEVDTSSGRPIVLFPDNPNALWYQIFIGEKVDGGLSLRHLSWYKKNDDLCVDGICRFYPTSNPIKGNYDLWVQTWGPAGFGVGDVQTELGGWAGPIPFSMDYGPPEPPTPLTPAYVDSGRPLYRWQRTETSTWYQIWTFDSNDPETYYANTEWIASLDAGCLESLTCTYTPDFVLGNNRTYQWYIQTWGPGGFASKGDTTDPFDRWVVGDSYDINAEVPTVPEAITPTKVVTIPLALTYTWVHQPGVSWYEFEIEQIDDLPASVTPVTFDNWYANEDLGCRDGENVCVLRVPSLLLPDGSFRWRLRAWNPAIDELAEDQWSEWVPFTVVRQ